MKKVLIFALPAAVVAGYLGYQRLTSQEQEIQLLTAPVTRGDVVRSIDATGRLEVEVADPYRYLEFGQRVAAGDTELAEDELAAFAQRFERTRTPLPAQPQEARVGRWLADVRLSFLPAHARAA